MKSFSFRKAETLMAKRRVISHLILIDSSHHQARSTMRTFAAVTDYEKLVVSGESEGGGYLSAFACKDSFSMRSMLLYSNCCFEQGNWREGDGGGVSRSCRYEEV
ncbi:unnamed protein product [Calypogeia fissa]